MSAANKYRFRLPDIGEGIAEAEIVAWHVAVGDRVEEDDPLADVMTDKATVEMTVPVSGRIAALNGTVGDMVPIGSVLAVLDVEMPDQADLAVGSETRPTHSHADDIPEDPAAMRTEAPTAPTGVGSETGAPATGRRLLASPAVRRRARALGIDLADVRTASDDRLRHADLDAFLNYNQAAGYTSVAAQRKDEQVKMLGLRRRIADNMAASKRNIPHFTYVESFDVTKVEAMRADLNASRGTRPKLTLLPFLIVAICRVLPEYPMLNARFDDEAGVITRHGAVHMGIATQTEAGLTVPVVRNAEQRNIWQLAEDIRRLAGEAREGKLPAAELANSTLTITSLGALGGILTTPVINRPEVAIIGPNRIVESVVLQDGELAVAKLMNVSISCDHRVIDGWDAARFMQALKHSIETPAILFAT